MDNDLHNDMISVGYCLTTSLIWTLNHHVAHVGCGHDSSHERMYTLVTLLNRFPKISEVNRSVNNNH